MLSIKEAKTAAKAIYLQAASMSGFEVSESSPSKISELVQKGFFKVERNRRPDAVAGILRLIAATLEEARKDKVTILHETDVDKGQKKICPVYPFE